MRQHLFALLVGVVVLALAQTASANGTTECPDGTLDCYGLQSLDRL